MGTKGFYVKMLQVRNHLIYAFEKTIDSFIGGLTRNWQD
jgi:hypothetical protein